MGCKPSKQPVCRNCNAQCSPVRMSYSSHPNRSPARTSYSSHPRRSLGRWSYSSHPREDNNNNNNNNNHVVALTSTTLGYLLLEPDPVVGPILQQQIYRGSSESELAGVVEAKTWSRLINEKISENIIISKTPIVTPPDEPETINAWELMEGLDDSSPLQPGSKSIAIDFDPNKIFINEEKDIMTSCTKDKLILYFTSLRGVRKTYEDCCDVQAILKNSGVRVDERDVSMHSGFKDELKELLGNRYGGGGLPKVFVGRRYIGGADEIRRFHDELQLDKVLEGCEMVVGGGGGGGDGGGCEACGDVRFLPCETCSGSCKIYFEVNHDKVESGKDKSNYGFQKCPDCNENGLIRCPVCCD